MENSIYLGLSRQMTLSNNLSIVANNLANMTTPGYRAQNLLFEEHVEKAQGKGQDDLSFVQDSIQYENTQGGTLSQTSNPLHVALNGPGFMGIQTPQGETVYTRAGDFTMDVNGNLVTSAGYSVVDAGGAPINIPAGSTDVKIDEQGRISTEDGEIGQLMIVEFEDPRGITPLGNNTYTAQDAPQAAINTTAKQGFVEGSNVKPVVEMTRMIEISRTYQQVQNTLEGEHQRLRTAIQRLTGQA